MPFKILQEIGLGHVRRIDRVTLFLHDTELEVQHFPRNIQCAGNLLEAFAPDRERQRFEARIRTLFETRWMMELVEQAMMRVKEFPDNGDQYYDILFNFYKSSRKPTAFRRWVLLNEVLGSSPVPRRARSAAFI